MNLPPDQHILIVEDEPDLANILHAYLLRDGFTATVIDNGAAAWTAIQNTPPDLVLLDVMLPEMDGISLLRQLRKSSNLPVILATARVDELDRLLGLELGADDYVCKPYSPREVVARVKAVLRRTGQADKPVSSPPLIEIDEASWLIRLQGERLDLTPTEFRLLATLAHRPGRVFSRSQLLDRICEDNLDISERAIDSHLKNLRKKLHQRLPGKELIRTVYGIGFAFEADQEPVRE